MIFILCKKKVYKHGIWLNFEVYRFWEPSEEAIMSSKGIVMRVREVAGWKWRCSERYHSKIKDMWSKVFWPISEGHNVFLFCRLFGYTKKCSYFLHVHTQWHKHTTWVKRERERERDIERKQSMVVLNKWGPHREVWGPHTAHAHTVFFTNIKPIIDHRSSIRFLQPNPNPNPTTL